MRSQLSHLFHGKPRSFQSLLLWRLLSLSLIASAALAFLGARYIGSRLWESAAQQLRDSALRVSGGLGDYLDQHLSAIQVLSESLEPAADSDRTFSRQDAIRALGRTEKVYPGFLTMLVSDANGTIQAAIKRGTAGFTPHGEAMTRIADREYFRIASQGEHAYVSGIFQGRGLGKDLIVAISAPVKDLRGRVIGVVEGSVDIKMLPLDSHSTGVPPLVLAVDGNGAIVYSSRPEQHSALEKWSSASLAQTAAAMPGRPYLVLDQIDSRSGKQSVQMKAVRFPLNVHGWQVIALQPLSVVEEDIRQVYWTIGALLVLISILISYAALILARTVAKPVESMAAAMRDYNFDTPIHPVHPGVSISREVSQIQSEFFRLAHRLQDSWQKLRGALAERDQKNTQLQELLAKLDSKVAERTEQLASSEKCYRQVVENASDIIYRCDLEGRVTFHNSAFALLLGNDPLRDHVGAYLPDLALAGSREKAIAAGRRQIRRRDTSAYIEFVIQTVRGERRWIGQRTQLVVEQGSPVGLQAIARDITEQKNTQQALKIAKERYALAVNGSNDGIWDWDLFTGAVYYSSRWKEMLGGVETTVCETLDAWFSRVHPLDIAGLKEELGTYASTGTGLFETEYRIRHADGTWRWVSTCGAAVRDSRGQAVRIAGSQSDITPGKLVDPLCGLPNRLAILDRLERLFDRHEERPDREFALLFLDLDRFKLVNDSLGHHIGDELLLGVSLRVVKALRSCAGVSGCVGRLGGDEFVVLLDETGEPETVKKVALTILQEMETPFHIAGTLIFASTSIGIASGSGPCDYAEGLLQNADAAMYHAKSLGRARYAVFDGTMQARAVERFVLETGLRNALERAELQVYYQPQVCLRTGRLTGFEALLRWKHSTRGIVGPAEFIPVAEETGLVVPIGRWVIEQACLQMAEWRKRFDLDSLSVSVNLSCRQFSDPELTSLVRSVLAESGLPGPALRLEVTESVLADDPNAVQLVLGEFAAMNVGLEIDDFGTGYSSLSQLHRLPFNTLKIDRSFVEVMDRDPEGRKIVASITTLAENLGIYVVAEGIETAAHWLQLETLGCHVGQGYYFGRPLDAKATTALIESRRDEAWPKPSESGLDSLEAAIRTHSGDGTSTRVDTARTSSV